MENKMSRFNNDDWFEPLEYAPENVICEVLEEDDDTIDKPYFGVNYDSDRFDSDTFSVWADL